jgi:glycosyltransferase involved in cell wall biosynthesis
VSDQRPNAGEKPRVSVLTVTYNHERYIAECLESSLGQVTNFPFEVVVGEDGSRDGTPALVQAFQDRHPARVRARIRARNVGPHQNMLDGFADCRGEYVALLEGDDYWTAKDKLQRQVDLLDAHPEAAACFHQAVVVDEHGGAQHVKPLESDGAFDLSRLLRENFVPTSSLMFRRSAFTGFPRWYFEVRAGDWLLVFLLMGQGRLIFIPEVLNAYRQHPANWSAQRVAGRIKDTIPLFERVPELLDRRHRVLAYRKLWALRAWLVAEQLTGGRFQRGWRALRESLRR